MPDTNNPELVLVTGVSGYLGSHVAQQLLAHGYRVRGTVRSSSNTDYINTLRELLTKGQSNTSIEFVEADLLNKTCWSAAVAGCDYICHVASPFPLEVPSHADELIAPAVDGTLAVLKAAADSGTAKRVVLTSSLAAVHDVKLLGPDSDPNKVYNEEDWVDPDEVEPYSRSKILAEKAAMKFVEELPDPTDGKKKLELTVMNPSYIIGPMITDRLSSSLIGIKRMLDKSSPAIPRLHLPFTDVRDVALAHVKALKLPGVVGKRYLLFSDCKWMKELAAIIAKEFKPLGYWVPSVVVPNTLVWLGSFFDRSTVMVVPRLGREFKLSNKRMIEELGIEPIPVEQSIIDTCHSLIANNLVKPTRKYLKSREPSSGDTTNAPSSAAQSKDAQTETPNSN
ncbi:putative oxidoreductase [Fragariocoptes setiger]|uniref:Oxidoreductase n=1 Tax=Fragariocoptes setiger TaxID=1670756 RepID=A0ABQ7SDB4_9ACAR|nr:putative oxidoreductase [Fragariocoptes setiger]